MNQVLSHTNQQIRCNNSERASELQSPRFLYVLSEPPQLHQLATLRDDQDIRFSPAIAPSRLIETPPRISPLADTPGRHEEPQIALLFSFSLIYARPSLELLSYDKEKSARSIGTKLKWS